MKPTLAEQAVGRLTQYLRLAGIAPSTEMSAIILEIVREGLERDDQRLIAWAMDRFEQRLLRPPTHVPPPCPPIVRGSIGYEPE